MAKDEIKFCKDCKHFRPDNSYYWFLLLPPWLLAFPYLRRNAHQFAKCAAVGGCTDHLVSRYLKKESLSYCSTERAWGCGRDAKFFEPRKTARDAA